eukprot:c4346_g1_i2.p1 GENE.c4346_g1_i2~~c4346_g1_i2.p1  ORF type:complete len:557 (-),score=75.44 c4346_g1_i2:188-1858(-)
MSTPSRIIHGGPGMSGMPGTPNQVPPGFTTPIKSNPTMQPGLRFPPTPGSQTPQQFKSYPSPSTPFNMAAMNQMANTPGRPPLPYGSTTGVQYRPSAPSSTPPPSAKRGRPPPYEPSAMASAYSTQAKRAKLRRRAGALATQSMPMQESKIYTQLLELERQLDHTISHRRKSISEATQRPHVANTKRRIVRVWVYNLHHNQPVRDPMQRAVLAKGKKVKQKLEEDAAAIDEPSLGVPEDCYPKEITDMTSGVFDDADSKPVELAPESEPASWTLRVQGKVQIDPEESQLAMRTGKTPPRVRFAQCFERAVVELDSSCYTTQSTVEWKSPEHEDSTGAIATTRPDETPQDGFELKRVGSIECRIKILLYPAANQTVFTVLPPLNSLVGVDRATRSQLLTMVWAYIHTHDLLDSRVGDVIVNNDALRAIFRSERTDLFAIPAKINEYLAPVEPIEIIHDLKLSGTHEANEACYEISLEVPEPEQPNSVLPTINLRQVALWDNEIEKNVKRLEQHKNKRDFMLGFSYAPIDFLSSLITSQARDSMVRCCFMFGFDFFPP